MSIYKDHPEKLNFYTITKVRLISATAFKTLHEQPITALVYECQTQCGPLMALWSGKHLLPAIGEKVNVTMNQFGICEVVGYFSESGFLGLEVRCDVRPAWHIKQNGDRHAHPLVFGAEVERIQT